MKKLLFLLIGLFLVSGCVDGISTSSYDYKIEVVNIEDATYKGKDAKLLTVHFSNTNNDVDEICIDKISVIDKEGDGFGVYDDNIYADEQNVHNQMGLYPDAKPTEYKLYFQDFETEDAKLYVNVWDYCNKNQAIYKNKGLNIIPIEVE